MSKYVPNSSGTGSVAGALPENAYDRTTNPERFAFHKTPNAVLIGKANTRSAATTKNLGFFFGSSASYSEKLTSDYGGAGVGGATDGASADNLSSSAHYVNFGKPTVGTTLHIHPTAYSASKADVNNGIVTFVYASGLTPQRP